MASQWLAARFNRPGFDIFDFNVWTICGDGDLMEGVASEAASLAGHLQLSNLCWIYDHNHVTLDGPARWSFTEDVATRFLGYGWNVTRVADANDPRSIVIAANGVATDDEDQRDEYLRGVVEQLRIMRLDGVDVVGYFHHTGIDGYEWNDGFARPRGLIDRTRAVKPAGQYLQDFLGT